MDEKSHVWNVGDIVIDRPQETFTVTQTCGHETTWTIDNRTNRDDIVEVLLDTPCQRCITAAEEKYYEEYARG